MKKQAILLLALSVAAATATAQLTIRPYAGINSNTLTEDTENVVDWKSKVGYQLGADLQIGNKFYVQPGVQMEFVKNTAEFQLIDPESNDFSRTHLRIPLMLGYAFGEIDGNFAARIFTGPNASILLSAKVEDDDIKDQLKDAVFGWNVGFGADISILFIDLGYQFGLSEVFEELNIDPENGSKSNSFYANVGLRVRI
jgi:hypothetical protein